MTINIQELLGKTFIKIDKGDDVIDFISSDGYIYSMYHQQDCCESVVIDDINGDLEDLVGSPILQSEEATSSDNPDGEDHGYDSQTWTFYKFATKKGYVTIRWYGSSNGYYSESVDIYRTEDKQRVRDVKINYLIE